MTTGDLAGYRGRDAFDADGNKIGTIDEIYEDTETGKPEWMAVKTGLFGSKVSFVPLADASEGADGIRVPYSKDQVKDAPNADPEGELSQEEEARLYGHYGLAYSERSSDSGLPDESAGTNSAAPRGRWDDLTPVMPKLAGTRERWPIPQRRRDDPAAMPESASNPEPCRRPRRRPEPPAVWTRHRRGRRASSETTSAVLKRTTP